MLGYCNNGTIHVILMLKSIFIFKVGVRILQQNSDFRWRILMQEVLKHNLLNKNWILCYFNLSLIQKNSLSCVTNFYTTFDMIKIFGSKAVETTNNNFFMYFVNINTNYIHIIDHHVTNCIEIDICLSFLVNNHTCDYICKYNPLIQFVTFTVKRSWVE